MNMNTKTQCENAKLSDTNIQISLREIRGYFLYFTGEWENSIILNGYKKHTFFSIEKLKASLQIKISFNVSDVNH